MEKFAAFTEEYEEFVMRLYVDDNYCGPPPTTRCMIGDLADRKPPSRRKTKEQEEPVATAIAIPNLHEFPTENRLLGYSKNIMRVPKKWKPKLLENDGRWWALRPDGKYYGLGVSFFFSREEAWASYARKLRYWGVELIPHMLAQYIPKYLSQDAKDDVAARAALSLVEGKPFWVIREQVRQYTSEHFRDFQNKWGSRSLDEALTTGDEGDTRTLSDVIGYGPQDWKSTEMRSNP